MMTPWTGGEGFGGGLGGGQHTRPPLPRIHKGKKVSQTAQRRGNGVRRICMPAATKKGELMEKSWWDVQCQHFPGTESLGWGKRTAGAQEIHLSGVIKSAICGEQRKQ